MFQSAEVFRVLQRASVRIGFRKVSKGRGTELGASGPHRASLLEGRGVVAQLCSAQMAAGLGRGQCLLCLGGRRRAPMTVGFVCWDGSSQACPESGGLLSREARGGTWFSLSSWL